MGSRGCRRINNADEFYEAAKNAIGFSRSGRAIVESYMDGPEFSVDAIVYKEVITICGLADRHIFFPPYFIEMGHTMPTVIEQKKQDMMLETFRSGIRALGISGKDNIGAAKGDIKLTANGPMIGEIAARLSGGYMSGWTYPYSSGALPIKAAILAAMGKKPEGLVPTKKWTCAERAFISIPGTVKQITINREQGTGENEKLEMSNEQLTIRDLKSAMNNELSSYVNDFFLRITEGSKVLFPENNVTKCGNIIASAEDRQTAIEAAESAARSVLIRLDPSDLDTEKFLHTEARRHGSTDRDVFPPDAFLLTEELKQAFYVLPNDEIEKLSNNNSAISAPLRLCENSSLKLPDPPCPQFLGVSSSFYLTPFPEFTSSNLRDYMGRTPEEALQAVRWLTGLELPVTSENAENKIKLGASFWAALIRGSYQGAVYYIDNLCKGEK